MIVNKLKKMFCKEETEENSKRKIENMVFLLIVLIITIVIINYIWNGNKNSNKTLTNSSGKQLAEANDIRINSNKNMETNINNYSDGGKNNLEERLESILSNINGVGNVKVFLNYSESSETVAMFNENSKKSITEETDTSGGIRKIESTDSQKEIVYQEENGDKTPIIQKIVEPKIEGAIIAAKGANDINIKTNIIQAVEAATGLATHKIQVFEMIQ